MVAGMAGQMRLHPCRVLITVAGVDDDEVVVGFHAVDDQIIDHAAFIVAEHAVAHVAVLHFGDVGGDEMLDVCQSVLAAEDELSHVRHVKKACLLANGHVLGQNARRVLHGHQEAAEFYHLCAKGDVRIV